MSRINEPLGHAQAPKRQSLEDRLDAALQQTQAAPVGFLNAEYLASMVTVVRQPPSLHFHPSRQVHTPVFDQLMNETIDPLSRMSTGQLAYAVAEMVVRREAEIARSKNKGAQEGLSVLGNLARMFEHLTMLQQRPGG